ncbi:Uncharacterised protein [Vibrio cholerae]|uniref:Uncharacterized protein n=1 Tax=Vibrio cholerae TaxID=666 RepID=A0A655RGL8_VIBCL|nr:Uncharacterised protein [Vibrio cholerae]CSA91260.1 Uncharacterised protein [Vibrio cholerae]CSA96149.1 Uncharacterised protein [Vibrio cholerae]CSA98809.1 Uncharacterised protein [Vibrio cholerae]CSB00245.1 Uncharacterised protein [Vibrio cholerae]
MGTTITLWDVVSKAVDVFLETIVPLHCHFHADAIFTLLVKVEDFLMDWRFVTVQVGHKRLNTPFIHEVVFFIFFTFIGQLDRHARVQE